MPSKTSSSPSIAQVGVDFFWGSYILSANYYLVLLYIFMAFVGIVEFSCYQGQIHMLRWFFIELHQAVLAVFAGVVLYSLLSEWFYIHCTIDVVHFILVVPFNRI
jgi:hypothetical protein